MKPTPAKRVRILADDCPPMDGGLSSADRAIWWMARSVGISPKEFRRRHWWTRKGFGVRELALFRILTDLDERPEEENSFYWFPDIKGASKSPKAFLRACRSDNFLKFRGFGKISLERLIEAMGYKRERIQCDLCGAFVGVDKDHPAYKIVRKGNQIKKGIKSPLQTWETDERKGRLKSVK